MNSAEQKSLRAKIHTALSIFYEPQGYKLNKTTGVFAKDGFEVYWGISKKYTDCIYFNPTVGVLNNEIKNSLKKIFPAEEPGLTIYQVAGCLLAQQFGVHEYDYLADNKDKIDHGTTCRVDQESNLDQVVADHANYMKKVGFPYFEKVNSIEGIYHYLSNLFFRYEDAKKIIDKGEVLSCVVASYLLNRSDTEELLNKFTALYPGNNYILDDVQRIKEYFIGHADS